MSAASPSGSVNRRSRSFDQRDPLLGIPMHDGSDESVDAMNRNIAMARLRADNATAYDRQAAARQLLVLLRLSSSEEMRNLADAASSIDAAADPVETFARIVERHPRATAQLLIDGATMDASYRSESLVANLVATAAGRHANAQRLIVFSALICDPISAQRRLHDQRVEAALWLTDEMHRLGPPKLQAQIRRLRCLGANPLTIFDDLVTDARYEGAIAGALVASSGEKRKDASSETVADRLTILAHAPLAVISAKAAEFATSLVRPVSTFHKGVEPQSGDGDVPAL